MAKQCKTGKGCYEDICGQRYTLDEKDSSTHDKAVSTKPGSDSNGGGIQLKNPHITYDMEDILYHLALGNKSHDLVEMFGDVKFVCLGGTPHRMERFAYFILHEIGWKMPPGTMLQDISLHSHRYALFKVGPVISVSHGMGMPSIGILLHELIKLMYHAKVKDPYFFRLGTCGGLGLEPGTVVVTTEALNGMLEPAYVIPILGKRVTRPALLDKELANEIMSLSDTSDDFKIISGKTVCTDDFYEGQGRLDGALCYFNEDDKFEFLKLAKQKGVTNIEMESLAMAAITHHVGIKCAVICVTLLDRLKGDQINQSKKTLEEWQDRPMVIAGRYIKKYLAENGEIMAKFENKPKRTKSIACPGCLSLQRSAVDPAIGELKAAFRGASKTLAADDDNLSVCSSICSDDTSSYTSNTSDRSDRRNRSSNDSAGSYGCLPGCSIVVSNADCLKRVIDESNAVD